MEMNGSKDEGYGDMEIWRYGNYKKRRRASKEKKERMFQTEGEAREKRDKKKLAVRETWYRLPIVKKKKELKRKRPSWIHSSRRKQHINTSPLPPEPQPPPPPHHPHLNHQLTRPTQVSIP